MPQLPKWVGDLVENAFSSKFRTLTVTEIAYPHRQLKRIRFTGDLSGVAFKTGQAVLLRIDDQNYRNYTPCFWDSEAGICDLLVHLHGNGPGSQFLAELIPGETLHTSLPRGFNMYRKNSATHFFFGDESTLGFFQSLQDMARQNDQACGGLFELDPGLAEIPTAMGLDMQVVPKSVGDAAAAIMSLQNLDKATWEQFQDGTFYLLGNARSIQQFRKALKEMGIAARNIVTQPYWAAGKIGL
jgi:NADPH-dependent ferric siderophore reductase